MSPNGPNRPRIGIPWRTSEDEAAGNRTKLQYYAGAVEQAGGEVVVLSLSHPEALSRTIEELDGFVLPGSPADLNPAKYGATNRGKSAPADPPREEADEAILSHAFNAQKPVLAICYGCQSLNVYLGGTLIEDIQSEKKTPIPHRKEDVAPEPDEDPVHQVRFTPESQLAKLAGATEAAVNSSHHQAVATPGRQLRITGQAPDGVVESVEWAGDANWVIGVQWHPERMRGDAFSERLFSSLIAASLGARRVPAARS